MRDVIRRLAFAAPTPHNTPVPWSAQKHYPATAKKRKLRFNVVYRRNDES
jgi:hypothetical protein